MKRLLPFALALITAACAAPQPGTNAHQRQLHEQAREHFLALKARDRKPAATTIAITAESPKPRLQPFLFLKPTVSAKPSPTAKRPAVVQPIVVAQPIPPRKRSGPIKPIVKAKPAPAKPTVAKRSALAKPTAAIKPAKSPKTTAITPRLSRKDKARRANDTIYEPTAEGRAQQRAWDLRQMEKFRAFEAGEAKKLGKTPAQLTRRERALIRARF